MVAYVVMPKFTTGSVVVARRRDEVLLVRKRGMGEEWGFPAGYLSYREGLAQTARRELAEETGVVADVTDAHHVRSYRQPWIAHIDHVFLVEADGVPHVGDAVEIAEARWFPVARLPRLARESALALEQIPDLLTRPAYSSTK